MRTDQIGERVNYPSPAPNAPLRELRIEQVASQSPLAPRSCSPVSPLNDPSPRPSPRSHDAHSTTTNQQPHQSTTYPHNSSSVALQSRPSSADQDSKAEWLPYTLRWPILSIPIIFSLALSVVISVLCWFSNTHYGLGKDDGSSILLFGWRFTPTLVVVLYCQLTVMIFDDVKRTEPYSGMAKDGGADASTSILQTQRSWWHAIFDGFSKKKNSGRRGWVLVCSSFVYIVGFLIVSPLSSSLLTAEDVLVTRSIGFNKIVLSESSMPPLAPNRDAYFRTLGNVIQSIPTSAWISNDHFVLPFWPAGLGTPPLGPSLSIVGGTWESSGTVITTEFQCEPMKLLEKGSRNTTLETNHWNYTQEYAWLKMVSPSGCKFNLELDIESTLALEGGAIWSNLSTVTADNLFRLAESSKSGRDEHGYQANVSANCLDKELLLVTTPWVNSSASAYGGRVSVKGPAEFLPNFTIHAEVCSSYFYIGQAPIKATISPGYPSSLTFDELEYRQTRRPMPQGVLNVTKIQNLTMEEDWAQYLTTPTAGYRMGLFNGAGTVLSLNYNFDLWSMVQAKNLSSQAKDFKQRFLGELIYSSWFESGVTTSRIVTSQGQSMFTERRIVLVPEVGILMAIFFFLSFCLLISILWFSRLKYRPLHLVFDPASPLGVASLVASHRNVLAPFRSLDQATKQALQIALQKRKYLTHSGALAEAAHGESAGRARPLKSEAKPNWRPRVVHLRTLTLLVISLISLVVGLVVLKHFSDLAKLYQTAFVYQTSFTVFNRKISTIAPYSIVPTIFAVAVGLWWDSLDKTFRSLQPYVSLSKMSRNLAEGAGLSYQSSYWAWAALKAARNRHWLLFVITMGSTLSQVFVITMSALFNREPGFAMTAMNATRSLEIRQIPQIDSIFFPGGGLTEKVFGAKVMAKAYSNLATNWINTATIQLTLNGPEPAWSRNGWSFVPIELSSIPNTTTHPSQRTGDDSGADGSIHQSLRNISLTTTAIRGRVECSVVPDIGNSSSWLAKVDLTKPFALENFTDYPDLVSMNVSTNFTGLKSAYTFRHIMFHDSPWNTSAVSHPEQVACCANKSGNGIQESALGYWSANFGNAYPFTTKFFRDRWPLNFTAKWIHGPALNSPGRTTLLLSEIPRMQALNCKPIIETAEADVVVDQVTGTVYQYSILGDAVPASSAWSDSFVSTGQPDAEGMGWENVITSYGQIFFNSLLGAAQIKQIAGFGYQTWGSPYPFLDESESLDDKSFNVRDERQGLNLDFMSYAMYTMVNRDSEALLDYETLLNLTQLTFSTYFQHFVSGTGWAYQYIDEKPKWNQTYDYGDNGRPRFNATKAYPSLHTNRRPAVIVSNRIETLRMNALATWLSVGILLWLAVTAILVIALQRTYFGSLIRNVDSIADVLVMIAGSDNLLDLVESRDFEELRKSKDVVTRLGWFLDATGQKRWGLEVVGGENPVSWIKWHEDTMMSRMNTATTTSSKLWEGLRFRTKTFGL
ncbi:hypothetical protein BCR34DRAFT_596983 [Clohesyomyces aquaticus]|uniref:Uncharacterized protein n=1 Tax=Clohesyomyces aquaticus TaxID=1231657 RepID=A0A1Y2A4U2_9PLEO|nr:hypothetical protein BCR34DRAFT_596983 [Clohesyomyces aquaticus]